MDAAENSTADSTELSEAFEKKLFRGSSVSCAPGRAVVLVRFLLLPALGLVLLRLLHLLLRRFRLL